VWTVVPLYDLYSYLNICTVICIFFSRQLFCTVVCIVVELCELLYSCLNCGTFMCIVVQLCELLYSCLNSCTFI